MEMTPEEILAELNQIRIALDGLPAESGQRAELEKRRSDLRTAARQAADATRHTTTLQAELDHLERRLAEMDREKINVPAWQLAMTSGGKLTVNDPAAYASRLNEALEDANAGDRAQIEDRVSQLNRILGK